MPNYLAARGNFGFKKIKIGIVNGLDIYIRDYLEDKTAYKPQNLTKKGYTFKDWYWGRYSV